MTDSNYCKILNCLQQKLKRIEKDINLLKTYKKETYKKEKGKLFNISDELKTIHLNPTSFMDTDIKNGESIFTNNKIYTYIGNACNDELIEFKDDLIEFKDDLELINNKFQDQLNTYNDKLHELNNCLDTNNHELFEPQHQIQNNAKYNVVTNYLTNIESQILNFDVPDECTIKKESFKQTIAEFSACLQEDLVVFNVEKDELKERLDSLNNCLSNNGVSTFEQKRMLNADSSVEDVDSVISDLNNFYFMDSFTLITDPEEFFFVDYSDGNEYKNIIYFESNTDNNYVLKYLDGKCNMFFECSTGIIYIFNENNNKWEAKCTISVEPQPEPEQPQPAQQEAL